MTATGYEPLNVLKPVADRIWIIDGAPVTVMGFPFPTRATVIQLENDDLWVHSPTPVTDDLQEALAVLGPVRHLIAPNQFHFLHIPEWAEAYPDAAFWSAPGTHERAAKLGICLPKGQELMPRAAEAPWNGQIDQLLVRGSRTHKEMIFHHKASTTTILTDLIEAFETDKLPARCRPFVWLNGIDDSDGKTPPLIRWTFRDKEAFAEDIETIVGWGARRVIIAHGRWYERNGTAELERAFRKLLGPRQWDRAMRDMKARERKDDPR
ncbi:MULTISPECIES: DUF4336 domain-containing protein [unclassified Roseovarius]|uniref:DUF4336 domain-containing protein n=1 Tax=unclassified Roseovarius TaxID=2614913 RepID=UPI00273E65D1|nr:DUF4336 domain-containing protein [Roseovarius sp. MMSF_3350]